MRRTRAMRAVSRRVCAVIVMITCAGCKSAVPNAPVVTPPTPPTADRKLGWILRLEQQRVMRDAGVGPAPESGLPRVQQLRGADAADLERLSVDAAVSIRLRAVQALGRVGGVEAMPALTSALQDAEPTVREAAAFALGLVGSKDGLSVLLTALDDPLLDVRVSAIEALGMIGDASAAPAIVRAASGCPARLAAMAPDDEQWPQAPAIEVCRAALYALVRLKHYDGIATLVLDAQGQPVSRWWPVAYALQRIGDPRAAGALLALASTPGVDTAGFALRGLAALKSPAVAPLAPSMAVRRDLDLKVRIAAVRAVGQVGGAADVPMLVGLLDESGAASPLGLEVLGALGTLRQPSSFDLVADLLTDRSPAVRAAALTAAARIDPDAFLLVLSGLGRDRDWTVRAALATALGTLPANRVTPALTELADDEDPRVHPAALEALAAANAPVLGQRLPASLLATDFVERATAARLIGERKLTGGAALLAAAYTRASSDTAYGARLAALEGLSKFGGDEAIATLRQGLSDREWPVRVRAAQWLTALGQPATPVRPAPLRQEASAFEVASLLHPPFSPHAFIDTAYGPIEVQLDVMSAPLTVQAFIAQARAGFFNGIKAHRVVPTFVVQAGDPRGDGEGGPGYTLRDELSRMPYVRGTLGMAIDGPETAGSQWFITLTPQPHLDGKYTVFGRVVAGWEVLDRIAPGDVIERIRIWDGVEFR